LTAQEVQDDAAEKLRKKRKVDKLRKNAKTWPGGEREGEREVAGFFFFKETLMETQRYMYIS
jgi:hypothetical protein